MSVQEYDAEGSLTTYLVRAGGYGGGIGDVVYKEKADGTGREFFLYNATGTTSALANDAGTVTNTSCYTAWGTETATVGTTDNVRKFSTKERSEVLGIDYFGFRYYDPELGRFITRDPSGYPDGPNNYLYCMNSPVNQIDPLGLEAESWEDKLLREREEKLAEQRAQRARAIERAEIQESTERSIGDYFLAPGNLILTGKAFPTHKESAAAFDTVVDDVKSGDMNRRGAEAAFATAELTTAGLEAAVGAGMTLGTLGAGTAGGAYLTTDAAGRGANAISRFENIFTGGSETVDPVRDAYNSAFGETYGPALRDASAVGVGMAEAAGRFAATLTNGRNSTEVVQRWMSNEELTSVQETGLLRGGRPGRTFVTDNANSSAQRARLRLALPQTPDVRVTVEVPSGLFSKPTPVLPYKNMPGGGMERVTTKPVDNVPNFVTG